MPEILNKAFLAVDSEVNQREGKFSGCTAIVAFVKVIEDKVKLHEMGGSVITWEEVYNSCIFLANPIHW